MSRIYMSYDPEQRLLLPPDLREWLPEEHLALFVSDVVEQLDLTKIIDWYERGDGRGRPPYHPLMMVKLLVYGYCTGRVSSRKIEKATYEDVAFRVSQATPGGVGEVVRAGAADVRAGGVGEVGPCGDRWEQTESECVEAQVVSSPRTAWDATGGWSNGRSPGSTASGA